MNFSSFSLAEELESIFEMSRVFDSSESIYNIYLSEFFEKIHDDVQQSEASNSCGEKLKYH